MPNRDHTPVRGVRVPDDLWNAAQQKARARGDSVSQYLRDKLREYVDEGNQTKWALDHIDRQHGGDDGAKGDPS